MQPLIRTATLADIPTIESTIARSIRSLGKNDYNSAQIEAALKSAFGVDTQLIRDGTYFVIVVDSQIAACGGWSKRRTLFGSDAHNQRDGSELDPQVDAAKIRAFFVAPEFARRGLGTMLLDHCENAATSHGFSQFELMATLPGVHLYQARGYIPDSPIDYRLNADLKIQFVPMRKLRSR